MFRTWISWQLEASNMVMIYQTTCGCELTRDQMTKSFTKAMICKEHKGRVKNRISYCQQCTSPIVSKNKRTVCKACKKLLHRLNSREWLRCKKLGKEAPVKGQKTPETWTFSLHRRGDYCKGIRVCYIDAGLKRGKLRCDTCQVYDPIFPGVDPVSFDKLMGMVG